MLRDMENSSSSSEENEGQRGGAVGLGSEEGVESEWGISDSEEGNMAGYWRTQSSQGTNRPPSSMRMGMNRTLLSMEKGTLITRFRLGWEKQMDWVGGKGVRLGERG